MRPPAAPGRPRPPCLHALRCGDRPESSLPARFAMLDWTRRDLLKTGLGIAASTVLPPSVAAAVAETVSGTPARHPPTDAPPPDTSRERLLLDADWKFHLGNANDPERDFGFGRDEAF